MEKFFRDKQELVFWLISALLALMFLLFIYFALSFLVTKTSDIFSGGLPKDEEIVKFKLNQIERIK